MNRCDCTCHDEGSVVAIHFAECCATCNRCGEDQILSFRDHNCARKVAVVLRGLVNRRPVVFVDIYEFNPKGRHEPMYHYEPNWLDGSESEIKTVGPLPLDDMIQFAKRHVAPRAEMEWETYMLVDD